MSKHRNNEREGNWGTNERHQFDKPSESDSRKSNGSRRTGGEHKREQS